MKNRRFIALGTVIVIVCFAYLIYPFFVYGISIVKVESDGRDIPFGKSVECYLQWHGRDQTTIEFTELANLGRDNYDYTKVVNNGEILTVQIKANYSWVEITYYDKTVSLHIDGKNSTLTHLGYL